MLRPDEDEVSAVQHAYNALIGDGEKVFSSEFQNQPMVAPEDEGQLTREEVAAKLNRLKRGLPAQDSQTLTAFINVQGKALYGVVCAWAPNFTGQVVDYGVFPEQHKRQFTLRQIDRSLQVVFPNTGQEGAWRAGLDALTDKLISREWRRDDGAGLWIIRCLIDAGDGNARNAVFEACRQSRHASVVMPSRGQGVTAAKKPLSEYKRKPGERSSEFHWRIPIPQGTSVRSVTYDTNGWKSFVRSRWRVALGDVGSLTLFGEKADAHRMFLDPMVSEYSTRTDGRGRRVDEWAKRPNVRGQPLVGRTRRLRRRRLRAGRRPARNRERLEGPAHPAQALRHSLTSALRWCAMRLARTATATEAAVVPHGAPRKAHFPRGDGHAFERRTLAP